MSKISKHVYTSGVSRSSWPIEQEPTSHSRKDWMGKAVQMVVMDPINEEQRRKLRQRQRAVQLVFSSLALQARDITDPERKLTQREREEQLREALGAMGLLHRIDPEPAVMA